MLGHRTNSNQSIVGLTDRVVLLDRFFDLRRIERRPDTHDEVKRYYKKSAWGYAAFHSSDGSIHMALNPNGKYDPNGYFRAPNLVWAALKGIRPQRVLELGSGNGFNLEQISSIAPTIGLRGIDLTPSHVQAASARLREVGNVVVEEGDFEKLPYESNYFDGLFSIESFCHALDLQAAFESAHRVLREGGLLVIVDAWRTEKAAVEDQALLDALTLTERSMAVSRTVEISTWLEMADFAGFELVQRTQLSEEVLPNLTRFEHLAIRFMKHRHAARFLGKVLRPRLLENVIAGYLMAESVRSGFHSYELVVLRAK